MIKCLISQHGCFYSLLVINTFNQNQRTMSKLRQILQLLGDGVSQSRICATVHCSKRTVSEARKLVDASGKGVGELLLMSDAELRSMWSPGGEDAAEDARKAQLAAMMPEIMKRLSLRHSHVQYVYESYYKKECPDGYGYTQFNKYVTEYRKNTDFKYHNTYEPGREWQIDFAGDPLYITDRLTKTRTKVVVLVCVMPYSNLPFMMALPSAKTEYFYHGLNKGLEFMGALPQIAKSDNMRQWVAKSDRYSPTFSDANVEWCFYYGIQSTACRVRSPRDKGPVESVVNQLYKYVYARIESEVFYDISTLNSRIWELLDEFCCLPYKGSTRWDIFVEYEKPRMRPLPERMYRFRMRKEVKLSNTYHVCVGDERHFYSVPFKYVGQKVSVMWDAEYVEVFVGDDRVAFHRRSTVPYGYTTVAVHMPEKHKAYEHDNTQNAATLIDRGLRIGESVRWAVEDILRRTNFPQQAYGTCNGLFALGKKYGYNRLVTACAMLRDKTGIASYRAVSNILRNNRDKAYGNPSDTISCTPYNDDVRGAAAYGDANVEPKDD